MHSEEIGENHINGVAPFLRRLNKALRPCRNYGIFNDCGHDERRGL